MPTHSILRCRPQMSFSVRQACFSSGMHHGVVIRCFHTSDRLMNFHCFPPKAEHLVSRRNCEERKFSPAKFAFRMLAVVKCADDQCQSRSDTTLSGSLGFTTVRMTAIKSICARAFDSVPTPRRIASLIVIPHDE